MIHRSEVELHPNNPVVFSEILTIKLFPIVNCEFFGYTESADDLLPEKFSDGG
jgi:hypothetical protein